MTALALLVSVSQCTVFAQEESVPQIRLSSKGLAYVNLTTYPANPVSGQSTVILLEFLDPQSKAPRADIYYRMVIRNETAPIFVLPGGSTMAGKVGIPFQFDKPGNYQVEIDLNDTDISKATSTSSLDTVTFPLYVAQGVPLEDNQTAMNTTAQGLPPVNTESSKPLDLHYLTDAVLLAAVAGLVAFMVRRKFLAKRKSEIPR